MSRIDPIIPATLKTQNRKLKGIWIPIAIWDCPRKTYTKNKNKTTTAVSGMSLLEKVMLAEIWHLEDDIKGCWAGNAYFAELFDVSEQSISNAICWLGKQGHISIAFPEPNNRGKREIRILENLFTTTGQNKNSYTGQNKNSYLRKNAVAPLKSIAEPVFSAPQSIVKIEYKNQDLKHSAEKPRAGLGRNSGIGIAAKARAAVHGPNPDIAHVVNYFKMRCLEVLNIDPEVEAKDYALVKKRLVNKSKKEVQQIIDDCLAAATTHWQRAHPTLSIFLSTNTINQLKLTKTGRVSSKSNYQVQGNYEGISRQL